MAISHACSLAQALTARRALAAVKGLLDLVADGKVAGNRGGISTWSLARELVGCGVGCPGLHEVLRHYVRNGVGAAKAVAMMALAEAPNADDLLLMIDLYVAVFRHGKRTPLEG